MSRSWEVPFDDDHVKAQLECLRNLFRTSPKLEELHLRQNGFGSLDLLDHLREAPVTLHTLSLPREIADGLAEHLPTFLPSLTTLRFAGGLSSLPLLARLAHSIEQLHPRVTRHFTFHIYPLIFPSVLVEVDRLRDTFVDTLRMISEAQLGHLQDTIDNNFTPDGNTVQTLSREVLDMWRMSFTTGLSAGVLSSRAPGTPEDYQCADDAFSEWYQYREISLAREWIECAEARGFFVIEDVEIED